jgi:capsular exopolysaccharide synthesis family protein
MELKLILTLVWRWLWLIALTTFLCGLLAYGVSMRITPVYESSATLAVTQRSRVSADPAAASEWPVKTYVELLQKRPVLEGVITNLQLGLDAEALAKQIEVSPIQSTALIELKASSSDPQQAAAIVNGLVYQVNRQGQALLGNDAAMSRYSLHILEPARIEATPVSPKMLQNVVLAALAGALLAVGMIFLYEYLNDKVRSAEDLERLVGRPNLATVAKRRSLSTPESLLVANTRALPAAEPYRMLRAHLEHAADRQAVRTLIVVSGEQQEGKSTTAANLAVVLAQSGKRTILVDANLRQPLMHAIFNTLNQQGLTTALARGDERIEQLLVPTHINNLALLPSGPSLPNALDLLVSERMSTLVEALKPHADIVLLDSPALLAYADAISLACRCDATILVVRGGRTRFKTLAKTNELLAQFNITPLGFVLNGSPSSGVRPYADPGPAGAAARHPSPISALLPSPRKPAGEPGQTVDLAGATGETRTESVG